MNLLQLAHLSPPAGRNALGWFRRLCGTRTSLALALGPRYEMLSHTSAGPPMGCPRQQLQALIWRERTSIMD